MFVPERNLHLRWNWFAILCYAASFAISVAFWTGVIRGVEYVVR